MGYSPDAYRHNLDQRAFEMLNSFPKFVKLCEAYNANYSEIIAKIGNMSDLIRLNENQIPEVYNLLPPICEKLGIEVPELYYEESKEMNACTGGTNKPFIIVSSELVEKCSPEQISSTLAHECGHIACKHTLYHSMARYLINGMENSPLSGIPGVRKYLTRNLVKALLFWDRCSELSADRAAVLCDSTPDVFVDTLLKIRGYGDNINRDEFMKQALDLKEFLNDNKSAKVMDEMLHQWNSHPTLATRAYECYEWSNSDTFKQILAGTYMPVKEEKLEEKEIVAAEVSLKSADNKEVPFNVLSSALGINIDAELERVNKELGRYTCNADKFDYGLAVFSGLYSGILDALFVGQCTISPDGMAVNHRQVNEFIQDYAKSRGLDKERLHRTIASLEKAFPVAQDNVWSGKDILITPANHHLADLAHHPTPIGLLSAIIVRFLRVGTFVNREGKVYFLLVDTSIEELIQIIAPVVISGVLNWLAGLAENAYEDESGEELPKGLKNLVHIFASTPILIEVAKCADNWLGHLVSDLGGSSGAKHGGAGIPGIFVSLLHEMSALPVLKDSGLPKFVNDLYTKDKLDFRHELSIYKNLGRQALPVIYNEICTRLYYFAAHLGEEVREHGHGNVNWNAVIPFNNRTVDRMLMVSSLTFTMADTVDAAVHAAVESCGNWVLFSGAFVTRFNYVGAGRAAIAIVKEVSNERKEAELIHEKLLLTEVKTVDIIQKMNDYRNALEQRVSDYLAEDLEGFLAGFDLMKQGLKSGDSDLVIKGNVVIQRVLGREPQFTNQKEFDELMESDEAIIF